MARTQVRSLAAAGALVVALSACGGNGGTQATPEQRPGQEADGDASTPEGDSAAAAPDFSFQTFEGDDFRLDEQRGTPVVLNFWESW